VPFLIGLWLCVKQAWRGRNGNLGLLPLALLVALLAGGMSATTIYLKPQWFAFALAVAAAGERKRPRIGSVTRLARPSTPTLRAISR
jgi:hypothetical protein